VQGDGRRLSLRQFVSGAGAHAVGQVKIPAQVGYLAGRAQKVVRAGDDTGYPPGKRADGGKHEDKVTQCDLSPEEQDDQKRVRRAVPQQDQARADKLGVHALPGHRGIAGIVLDKMRVLLLDQPFDHVIQPHILGSRTAV